MTGRSVATLRIATATACVALAGAVAAGYACTRAAGAYDARVQLELARASNADCNDAAPPPSRAARVGMWLRGDAAVAERWRLATELARASDAPGCAQTQGAKGDVKPLADPRLPYFEVLAHARTLAARGHGPERARALGLLTLTLMRVSQLDPANASSFVAEAETAARDAVRLKPRDTMLQANLELVLRQRKRDEDADRAGRGTSPRGGPRHEPAQRAPSRPGLRHSRLPGPADVASGGY